MSKLNAMTSIRVSTSASFHDHFAAHLRVHEAGVSEGAFFFWSERERLRLARGQAARGFDVEPAYDEAVQHAGGLFVAQYKLHRLTFFHREHGIGLARLIGRAKRDLFGN